MTERLKHVQDILQRKVGKRDSILERQSTISSDIVALRENLSILNQVRNLYEIFTKSTESKLRNYIEPVVNEALEFVFNQELFFHLLFVNRRNQMEVDFILLRNRKQEELFSLYSSDPEKYSEEIGQFSKESRYVNNSFGGAVNQVLSCVLRLIIAELLKLKGPICLDEPTSAFHPVYADKFGQLISSLSRRFNRQYIIITHSTQVAVYADKCYQVSLNSQGISTINESTNED